jgi:hypothetical protein
VVVRSVAVVLLRCLAVVVGVFFFVFSGFLADSGTTVALLGMYIMMVQAILLICSGILGRRILFLFSMAILCSFIIDDLVLGERVKQSVWFVAFILLIGILCGLVVWFEKVWWQRSHGRSLNLGNAEYDYMRTNSVEDDGIML